MESPLFHQKMPNSNFKTIVNEFSNQAKLFSLWPLLKYNLHKEKHWLFVGYHEHIRNVQVKHGFQT
jgi:hypothetical protein